MARKIIVLGDATDHGGKVIGGSPTQAINGRPIARLGDQVDCPQKGHGINPIVEGDSGFLVNGIPVALEGHKTACGCSLIGSVSATRGGEAAPSLASIGGRALQKSSNAAQLGTQTMGAEPVVLTSLREQPGEAERQRDRSIYAAVDGVMEVMGWENPKNHKQGYGYRMKLRAGNDKSLFVYAHIDPDSVKPTIGASVVAGDLLGEYADPTNGGSTGPHLHLEWWSSAGERLDPEPYLNRVMPGHVAKDVIRFRGTHPVTGQPKMHNGYDLIGPWGT